MDHLYKNKMGFVTAALVAGMMVFVSCDDNSTGGEDEEPENIKTGFIVNAQTPSGTYIAKHYSEMPSGSADVSDGGTDFQNFFPIDSQDGALYMARPDGSGGFSKMVVNAEGEIVEEGFLPTVDEGSYRIKIRDDNTGVFHDRNTPNEITIFDPSDLSISGTIDMSAAFTPGPQRYDSFYFRDNLVFAPLRPEQGGVFDSTIVHIADLSTATFVGTSTINSGETVNFSGFGNRNVDENGNVYVTDIGNPTGANPISSILKIPAGSNEFDTSYDFNPALIVNPSNTLLSVTNGFYYHQNGTAYAQVSTEVPQELLELLASVGGNPANLSDEQINQALNILFTAENGRWARLDLDAQTVTVIDGIPKVSPFITSVITEANGKLYFPVVTESENAVYEYDPATEQSQKAFDVEGGALIGVYNLSNDG